MAKNISGNIGYVGTSTTNYIKQIAVDGTNHDLALTKGITFFNGEAEVSWDGTQALEVVIPTLSDIVANPVTLKGVIDKDGAGAPSEPQNGDLVYIGENCTFASQVCEAGDMAVYYNKAWHVISGENQISLAGTPDASGHHSFSLTSEPTTVATVEGKQLKLGVDFGAINSALSLTKNGANTINLSNGEVAVSGMYITLAQGDGTTNDISTEVSISLPTVLASGLVTISDKVLQAADFTFTSGSFPTISKNAAAIAVTTSHNMSISKLNESDGATGDYLTSVVAIKGVSLVDGDASDNSLTYVSGLVAASGKSFVSGIHAWTEADGQNPADFEVPGAVSAASAANTFVSGLSEAAASGDVVSSISVGAVTIGTGSDVLTGLSGGGSSVITAVDFGSVVQDANAQWFFSGLGEASTSGDVVTSVSVGAVSFESDNSSSFASNAMVSASVSNHVLSFSTGSFMTPVKLSKVADTVNYKSFTKSGAKLSGTSATPTDFTTGGINQATTSISYKSVLSKAVELTQGDAVKFYLDKEEEHNYTAGLAYKKISTVDATFTKNSPKLENTTITASIPANAVAVGLNDGTLPTFTVGTATGTISGEVGTALTTSNVSWLGIDPAKKNMPVAGEYTLTTANASGDGVVEVAASGIYEVSGKVTIAADTYVTDVDIVTE